MEELIGFRVWRKLFFQVFVSVYSAVGEYTGTHTYTNTHAKYLGIVQVLFLGSQFLAFNPSVQ